MPNEKDPTVFQEGNIIDPPPDPWAPPRANYAQAASIATGATGVALLAGDMPASGTGESLIALLPDPHQVFAGTAHLLGFQLNASDTWTWGFILVVLGLALNIYSYVVRYRYATWVKPRWDAQLATLQRAQTLTTQAATPQVQAQGFVAGDA